MDRTIAESSSLWTIRDHVRDLSDEEASKLLVRLTKSTTCAKLFQKLLLHEENHELMGVKDYLERNPIRFDPNPWDYLPVEEFHHSQAPSRSIYSHELSILLETPRANISSLPTEILLQIGAHLPAVSRAVLALVNRDLHRRLSSQYHGLAIRKDWWERFELLQLLERDTKDMLACPRCQTLHFWRKNACEFRWWKSKPPGIPHKFPYIPRFYLRLLNYLDYGFARTIGRLSVKFGPESLQCQQVLKMATPKLNTLWLPTVRASRSISNRIVDGNLISRSQIAVALFSTTGTLTNHGFCILATALTAPQFQICDHLDFPAFLRYLDAMPLHYEIDLEDDEYPDACLISESDRWGTDGILMQDNYQFYKSSRDYLGILDQFSLEKPARQIPEQNHHDLLSPGLRNLFDRSIRGQVRSCPRCATDFGLGVQYVEGVGKALVMTMWRDVGGPCQKGEDELRGSRKWKWDSHRCDRHHYHLLDQRTDPRRLIQAMSGLGAARTAARGSIYKAFESAARGVDQHELSAIRFHPDLDAEDIFAMQQTDAGSHVGFDEFFAFGDYMARERQARAHGQLLEEVPML
ncbi:hypothetical protein V8F20_008310 [Naviculisporaceae sp. PSN 640]